MKITVDVKGNKILHFLAGIDNVDEYITDLIKLDILRLEGENINKEEVAKCLASHYKKEKKSKMTSINDLLGLFE